MKKKTMLFAVLLFAFAAVLPALAETAGTDAAAVENAPETEGQETVELTFDDGTVVTAFVVDPFDHVNSWDKVGEWSKEKINFGSIRGTYYKLYGQITGCYGMSVNIEMTEKKKFSDTDGFKIGLLRNRKGDYGEYHNTIALQLNAADWLTCCNKTPGTFNGFMTMTERPLKKGVSFKYTYWDLKLYFASPEAAEEYIASIVQ